jgi:hypothetical protein
LSPAAGGFLLGFFFQAEVMLFSVAYTLHTMRHYATNRKVAGSISDEVIEFFN